MASPFLSGTKHPISSLTGSGEGFLLVSIWRNPLQELCKGYPGRSEITPLPSQFPAGVVSSRETVVVVKFKPRFRSVFLHKEHSFGKTLACSSHSGGFRLKDAADCKAVFCFFPLNFATMSGNFFNLLKLIELFKRQTVFNYLINHDHIGDTIKNNRSSEKE